MTWKRINEHVCVPRWRCTTPRCGRVVTSATEPGWACDRCGGGKVAALYVQKNGAYYGMPDVDPWDEERDARLYAGPWPVVAHPPCARWCRLAGLVEARWGHKKCDDGGCFEAALAAVRRWGGVLEHPAYSDAWAAYGLNRPPTHGGWANADFAGGWTCHVEQGRYGHPTRKATWLYAIGTDLPSLDWGVSGAGAHDALVSWCANHTSEIDGRRRVGKAAAAATPPAFRDLLLGLARSVYRVEVDTRAQDRARRVLGTWEDLGEGA